ncbi:DE-cadherin-like [Macrosteles quadrilineatus]|uniref:DE-cadherin-like n=1 Tax=Macrosteles quadrilineatus TaxID=74068 RepID=UPI0023E1D78C|nr:DE-cadherin-like [Macrosteles quadrilineatus]
MMWCAVDLLFVSLTYALVCVSVSGSEHLERTSDIVAVDNSLDNRDKDPTSLTGRSWKTNPLTGPVGRSSARLRHSRHLLGRGAPHLPTPEALLGSPFADLSGTSIYSMGGSGVQVDNHKPVFTNCLEYQPSVKEEEPTGTPVLTVKAKDRDPPESGGNITYTLISTSVGQNKFKINPVTGEISTAVMLDRDEPSREKEVYLSVRATDNGRPELDDVCTIKVTIEDINDNPPVFDKVNYVESVPKDLVPGHVVMKISATDIDDGNNSKVFYDLQAKKPEEANYFHIENNTGVIILNRDIDKDPGYHFLMRATATDQGEIPNSATIDLEISVVESHKKAPQFTYTPQSPIILKENISDFSYNIAKLQAKSNTDEKAPVFELVHGRTDQTNKDSTFLLETAGDGTTAYIRLGKNLDYESITEYTLTVRIQNKYNLASETVINIQLEDVNDRTPTFTEVVSGSVSENEPPGTPVMQVRAIDGDGTSANNQVMYELVDNTDVFTIDPYTGNITTLVTFDREERASYNVKVIAIDNSPSANKVNGEPNKGQQTFRIEIADKNDHAPKFNKERYVAEAMPEDANINHLVTQVEAQDKDSESSVTYSIIDGNTGNAFLIEPKTGKIRVNSPLDYENTTSYTLKVRAFDGVYEDQAYVDIKIENVNDNPPKFLPYVNNITIEEEKMKEGCIMTLKAYDPDIPDRDAPQHIVYNVVNKQDQQNYLTINNNGCLSLLKPLDRDPPNGFAVWQVRIRANDEDGTRQSSLQETTEVIITLEDINDNEPYLDMPGPVVWKENQLPGTITTLSAKDNDGPDNGPPFKYTIANSANSEIRSKFGVSGNQLSALVTFDREEKKSYQVQIAITDSGQPTQTGTSTLTVVIGDENDNPMKKGSSDIFVYNYKGEAPDTEIGRVYVEDLDDWDLPDKSFQWEDKNHTNYFDLNDATGMITMLQGTPADSYLLTFLVTEEAKKIPRHTVTATVNVTVKEIPEEAVDKSGSIRFAGITAEEFITPDSHDMSKKMILQAKLAHLLNTSLDNVDVFTVLHSPHNTNQTQLDVRFSAHGSPYYSPEKINAAIDEHRRELEKALGVSMLMVNIDECLVEKLYCTEPSCTNFLNKSKVPSAVYTNTTSFVGVRAVVDPLCICDVTQKMVCYNGGTPVGDRCECAKGFEGPHCETVGIGFKGDGWALYPPFASCVDSHLSLHLRTHKPEGLVFYIGPTNSDSLRMLGVQDFMSLELRDGYPVLLVDFGSGTVKQEQRQFKLSDDNTHRIDIYWSKSSIELQVDNCKLQSCLAMGPPIPPNELLNVNGPLQVGGTFMKLAAVAEGMNWNYKPHDEGFSGCVYNLTFNGKLYNLGDPSLSKNTDIGCNSANSMAITFGIDRSFLLAILICLAVLTILLLAVVVHRRNTDDLLKEHDDTRENIINYEEEGGGEGDMTGYDLNVLRLQYDHPYSEKQLPTDTHLIRRGGPDDVPDICGFLDGKKQSVDNDPETNPFDDVRHYAYEGDGNTTGSLSSLASGTDEGDLNFDYLSNFGPRFRKLADMYGEDPSDEEEDNFHNAASESWC